MHTLFDMAVLANIIMHTIEIQTNLKEHGISCSLCIAPVETPADHSQDYAGKTSHFVERSQLVAVPCSV